MTNLQRLRVGARRLDRWLRRRLLDPWHRWRLERRWPELIDISPAVERRVRSLTGPRREYVRLVSTDAMTASAQLCAVAQEVASRLGARRIADLGSGFSSYALRSLARERGELEVWSVDDDEEWLDKTRAFLGRCGLSAENCVLWAAIEDQPALLGSFDLVIHDLGHAGSGAGPGTPQRARLLGGAIDLLRPGGVLLLDDVHARPYRRHARRILRSRGLRVHPMVRVTLDRFGRYAWLVAT